MLSFISRVSLLKYFADVTRPHITGARCSGSVDSEDIKWLCVFPISQGFPPWSSRSGQCHHLTRVE